MPDAIDSDFLIIGSGIAGLLSAIKLSEIGSVSVLTKKEAAESNTNYAQGGIAAVISRTDDLESHVADTLKAGAGLCREDIVRLVVEDAPVRIRELASLGVSFSRTAEGYDLGLEAGHSHRRILHAQDMTGREIERALLERCRRSGARIYENHAALDLFKDGSGRVRGAYALDVRKGRVLPFSARATILASGGAGKVYLYTTNPDIATGDGMAMAWRAEAALANMEFVQFHPTCLYRPGQGSTSFLLSEALRGEGGRLLSKDGRRFMPEHDPRAELAPRDIVARAVDSEIKSSGHECVYLDMTHLPAQRLKSRFPNIHETLLGFGIDMAARPVPVVPAAHYFCGGVRVNSHGETDLPGLFALGEASCTGLHGANRLASNSLLEGCVFAHRIFLRLSAQGGLAAAGRFSPPPWPAASRGADKSRETRATLGQAWDEIRRLMWGYVGIVRSDERLRRALKRLEILGSEIADDLRGLFPTQDSIELLNLAQVATAVVLSALSRRESRGLHFNSDHPSPDPALIRDTLCSKSMQVTSEK